jgi:hypothetical protein
VFHHGSVLVEERLALGAVCDHRVGPRRQLDMGGKTTAPGADNARRSHLFSQAHELSGA